MGNILNVLLFGVAVVLISKGADWFIEVAVKIAEATHIPKVIIGATIVSMAITLFIIYAIYLAILFGVIRS